MQVPKIGEQWIQFDKSPWPMKNALIATIVDVKDGWVLCDYQYTKDSRMTIGFFLENFKPYVSDAIPGSDTSNSITTC